MLKGCLGVPGRRCPNLVRGASRCEDCQRTMYQVRNVTRDPFQRALYRSAEWVRIRDAVVGSAEACHWCGTSAAVAKLTADHIAPVRLRPDLALEPSNVVAACTSCQGKRKARPDVSTWQAWERTPRGASRW